jgi:hypothetical protein
MWRLDAAGWQPAGSFGVARPGGASAVRSLAAAGGRLFCVTSDGVAYSVWTSDDRGTSWRAVPTSAQVRAEAETAVVVSGDEHRVVLLADNSDGGRIYTAETPG